MSDELFFRKYGGADAAHLDVLFVHGLTGDPFETWQSSSSDGKEAEFWPHWLCEKFPGICIYALGYPASIFGKIAKKEMTLFERAQSALEHLAANDIGKRPIAFITHSLGGLLTKQIIRASRETPDEGWAAIGRMTRLVAFLATPHTGATLGSAVKSIIPRFASTHISTLSNEDGYLHDLNSAYRDFAPKIPIKTVVYYEKHKTKGMLVVDKDSADPGVAGVQPVPMDADHIGICKPKNREAPVYIGLCRHIKNILDSLNQESSEPEIVFDTEDYTQSSSLDRRDLLQKLIDAGREHEYEKANDFQNKFAQKYYRLGLHTDAKLKSDRLLEEVEQRFTVHVYNEKICKGASDEEIAAALQQKVIDSICEKYASIPEITAMTVYRALYFLTEQCHIRWDAA